jgi:hypothetical protein
MFGILQNATAPMIIDHPPFFDLFQGSKATEAGEIIIQAAISSAWRLNRVGDDSHC